MRAIVAVLLSGAVLAPRTPFPEDAATERLLDYVERRSREAGDPSDPRAAAGRLGFDRSRIAEFVRKEVVWEPYAGILRGASGTLLARAGNSVDRALLLQAMLEAAGEKTRLMRADVAEADGAALLEAFRKQDVKARWTRPELDLAPLAVALGVEKAALQAIVAERRRDEDELVRETVEAAKAEAARLALLVGAIAGRTPAAPKEHVWVQVYDGTKKDWVDLDVSELPKKGARLISPQELAAQRRSVTIKLVMNRKAGAKAEPVVLLNVPSDLQAVLWKGVDLLVQPSKGQLPSGAKMAELDDRGRVEAIRAVKMYRGGLIVDGKFFGGIPFDLTGKTFEVDAGGRVGPAKVLGGGVGKAFGGLGGGLGGGGGKEEAAASTFESLVLEVSLKEPGGAETVHRRTLVRASGPEETIKSLPVLRYSFLFDGAPLPPGERPRRDLAALAHNAAAFRKLIKGGGDGVHVNPSTGVSSLMLRFADLRRRLLIEASDGEPFVQDRPGLYAEMSQASVDEKAGRLVLSRGIDIFENPGLFKSPEGALRAGVAETVLEAQLVLRAWPGDGRRSAWTAIERARLLGGAAEVKEKDGRKSVRWSADAEWVVDPASGQCVGRVPSGAGQGMVEAAWENASEVCNYSDLIGFAAASKVGPAGSEEAANMLGQACSIAGGTWARDKAKEKMDELTAGLWNGSIAALAGM